MDNSSLGGVEKLHYLKTSLSGEPPQLLQNVPLTEVSFAGAWRTITARYENLRLLIQSQLAALSLLPTMQKEVATNLKPLLNGTLEALHWDDRLVFGLVNKLDVRTQTAWETSIGARTDPPTFEQLQQFLFARLEALEAMEDSSSAAVASNPSATHLKPDGRLANTSSKTEGRSTKYPLCSEDHIVLFCSEFKRMNPGEQLERKQVAAE